MNRVGKALKNPTLAIRALRSNIRKFQLNEREERISCADRLSSVLDADAETLREYHREVRTNETLQGTLFNRLTDLEQEGELTGNTSPVDAETLYVVCRAVKPDIVVETGVRYGSYDSYILAALEENGYGELHSIDLPGQPSEKFDYGYLIPDDYRDRWNLHLGDSAEILGDVLREHPPDVFLHDSLHTKEHMRWEYEIGHKNLSSGGILASHDVLLSDVFQSFADETQMPWTRVRNTGVAVKQ